MEKNYDYISEKIKDYKEEVQISDSLMTTLEEDWFIRASLHMLDEEDILDYNETNFKNMVITATELIIGLCAGGVLVLSRNFDYLGKVEDANLDYQEYVEEIQKMQKKLTVTNQKILSLSKKVGKVNGE